MVASRRPSLVAIQRAETVKDECNEDVPTWTVIGTEWARITYGAASERREAAQTQAQQSATFDINDDSLTRGLKATDRIVWNGINWDISAPGIPKSGGELQFTTTGAAS